MSRFCHCPHPVGMSGPEVLADPPPLCRLGLTQDLRWRCWWIPPPPASTGLVSHRTWCCCQTPRPCLHRLCPTQDLVVPPEHTHTHTHTHTHARARFRIWQSLQILQVSCQPSWRGGTTSFLGVAFWFDSYFRVWNRFLTETFWTITTEPTETNDFSCLFWRSGPKTWFLEVNENNEICLTSLPLQTMKSERSTLLLLLTLCRKVTSGGTKVRHVRSGSMFFSGLRFPSTSCQMFVSVADTQDVSTKSSWPIEVYCIATKEAAHLLTVWRRAHLLSKRVALTFLKWEKCARMWNWYRRCLLRALRDKTSPQDE